MIQLVAIHLIALCALTYLLWLIPAVTRPTVAFGVRIPPDKVDAAIIDRQRHRYRRRILLGGSCLVPLATAALILTEHPAVVPVAVVTMLAVGLSSYLPAHFAIAAAKRDENWYAGLRQRVAVDTSLRTDPPRFPWLWAVPAVVVLIGTAVLGVLLYPSLPDRIALHFGAGGQPDRYATTSIGAVFATVFVQAFLTVLILGMNWLVLRARPELDVDDPSSSARRHRHWVTRVVRALLVLLTALNLSMALTALASWRVLDPGAWLTAAILTPTALAGVLVVAMMIRGRTRQPAAADGGKARVAERDDDRYWRGGLLYVNRNDPAVLVPKRFGIGWTLNVGNPLGWMIIGALVAGIALVAILRA